MGHAMGEFEAFVDVLNQILSDDISCGPLHVKAHYGMAECLLSIPEEVMVRNIHYMASPKV